MSAWISFFFALSRSMSPRILVALCCCLHHCGHGSHPQAVVLPCHTLQDMVGLVLAWGLDGALLRRLQEHACCATKGSHCLITREDLDGLVDTCKL